MIKLKVGNLRVGGVDLGQVDAVIGSETKEVSPNIHVKEKVSDGVRQVKVTAGAIRCTTFSIGNGSVVIDGEKIV